MRGTVSSVFVAKLVRTAEMLGLDADALARTAGVTEGVLEGPEHLVPEQMMIQLWTAIDQQAETKVAPRIVEQSRAGGLNSLGVLGALLASCTDLREYAAIVRRYGALAGSIRIPHIEVRPGGIVYTFPIHPSAFARLPSWNEAMALAAQSTMQTIAGPDWRPLEVHFHHEQGDKRLYEEWFGCSVQLGARCTRVVFARELAEQRFVGRPAITQAYLLQYAEQLLPQRGPDRRFADQVRERLPELLRTRRNVVLEVATELGVSERTLQRYLRSEGTSFAEVLTDTRRSLADAYLENPRISVRAVAELLGYSSPGAFHQAFRQWTGMTPGEYREKHPRQSRDGE